MTDDRKDGIVEAEKSPSGGNGQGRRLFFRRVEIENWRNFTKVAADLQTRVILVGPNASGKSNLLDVFRFLHDIVAVGGGLQAAVNRRGGVSGLRALAARKYSDIRIQVTVGTSESPTHWIYEIVWSQDNRSRPILKRECVARDGETLFVRPDEADKRDPERLTQTYIEQVNVNREFRELCEFLLSVRYLHIVPQLIREPDRSVGRAKDPFGGDFLETIASTPDKTRNARLRRIRDALKVAVPQLIEIGLWRDTGGTPHLRHKCKHWRPQGAWQTEDQFSDGTLRLMGLLWSLLEGSGPLLLEEPELSFHPEVVRCLPQMLARLQRRSGRQVLLSTHSADLLRDEGIGLDEVFLLLPRDEGTDLYPASSLREARELLLHGHSLADIVIPRTKPENAQQLTLFGEI